MPIAAELRAALYNTSEWITLSRSLRLDRAASRCECTGQCGIHHRHPDPFTGELEAVGAGARCAHVDGRKGLEQTGIVRLGVAHLWQAESGLMVPAERLIVLCQGCHLRFDLDSHLAARRRNRLARMAHLYGQRDLFGGNDDRTIN